VHVEGGIDQLEWRLERQLDAFAPRRSRASLEPVIRTALPRVEGSFSQSALPGYRTAAGETRFDPVQTDQYAMFVWFCSNVAWQIGDRDLAADLFALNKSFACTIPLFRRCSCGFTASG
jgi:hypothetical protein